MALPADKWKYLQEKLKKLPPEEIEKVADFAEFLQSRQKKESARTPDLKWAGALEGFASGDSSVELQEKITEWWGESVSD